MEIVISFNTSMFDVSTENKNPLNPIFGESLLKWLKLEVGNKYNITDPEPEDWGWYSYINWNGREYLIGTSTEYEEGDDPTLELEWIFHIDKHRSFKEKLLGQQKISNTDECVLFLKSKLETEIRIKNIAYV
jgi:hypothetical protein